MKDGCILHVKHIFPVSPLFRIQPIVIGSMLIKSSSPVIVTTITFVGIIVGAVVLCIIALLLVTVIGMAIFIKRKQFAWADESKVLKRYMCIIYNVWNYKLY